MKGTQNYELVLGQRKGQQQLLGYADADWAESKIDTKSNIGSVIKTVLFFDLYCSHHTQHEKFNSFLATDNILLYFFRNQLGFIEVLNSFLDGI